MMARSAGTTFRTAARGRQGPGLGLAGQHHARQLAEQAHRAIADLTTRGADAPPARPKAESEAEDPARAAGGAVAAVTARYVQP